MSRVLALLLVLGVLLPCYVWYSAQQGLLVAGPAGPAASAVPCPYQLLNESAPPPLEELATLAEDDETSLIDLRSFRWLLGGARPPDCGCDPNQDPADGHIPLSPPPPLVLVLVHTAVNHVEHRRLIRETWGSPRPGLLVRFLVGLPSGLPSGPDGDADRQQRLLDAEAAEHGDLVQGSFVDAYRNMTYKHAMALKWFATRCPNATYLLKVDDDVMVNSPVLLDFLGRALSPFGARRLLACSVIEGARPKRTWRSKWHVGWREFAEDQYPTYCAGWAVLYSPDVALALYREAQREPYFWIDDVLVTGVLASRLGFVHARWGEGLVLQSERDLRQVLTGELKPTFMVSLWYDVGIDLEEKAVDSRRTLWALWARIQNGSQALPTPPSMPQLRPLSAPPPLQTRSVDQHVKRGLGRLIRRPAAKQRTEA